MFILADATKNELESLENNLENITKDVSKISEITGNLIDKAVAFGINLLVALVIFLVGRFIIKKLLKMVDKIMEKSSADVGVEKFLHSMLKIILYGILILIICGQVGIETTSFAAVLASGGLAVGLAFEGSLSNFAGGVLILIMKPFVVGDYIESNGVEGTVEKIDIFYTSLNTVDNKAVKLPNGTLSNSVLTNYSMHGKRRVDVCVGIGYDDDIKKAKSVLTLVMQSYGNILPDEETKQSVVVVKSLGDSSINLEVRMWVPTEDYWDARFYLTENIRVRFAEEGINIPYNQLDVRIVKE